VSGTADPPVGVAGPCVAGPCVAGPCVAGPCVAGPCVAGPCVAGLCVVVADAVGDGEPAGVLADGCGETAGDDPG